MTLTITHPGRVITLPSPIFGDTQTIDVGLIRHLMQDGTLRTYRREGYEVLTYSFVLMTCGTTHIADLEWLFLNGRGVDLTISFDGTSYLGRLITESLDISNDNRYSSSTTLAFRGKKI